MDTKQQAKHVQWKPQKILSLENPGSYELRPRAEVNQPVTVPPKGLAGPSGGRQPLLEVVSEVLSSLRQILRLCPRCCFLLLQRLFYPGRRAAGPQLPRWEILGAILP